MTNQSIALVDMDGTLCDYDGAMQKELDKITTEDILSIVERKKLKGSDAVALELRNLMKRKQIFF